MRSGSFPQKSSIPRAPAEPSRIFRANVLWIEKAPPATRNRGDCAFRPSIGKSHGKSARMKDANLSGLSPLWLISLALILGTFIVIAIPISIASGESIKASDWIGFAGSIAAGVMTLVAATLAWFAVQRQIKAQEVAEERATQRSTEQKAVQDAEAKYAAVIVLTQTVHAAAAALNVTTQYVDALQ